MGSHRQGCSHVSGHKEKSEHHVTCRQTCVLPKQDLCLSVPICLPTCTWMCVSHFFLFFSLIFLFASCPCMLAPGSACPCLHLPVPGFLCLPMPTDLHPTMPGHTCCCCPCLPACTMSLVGSFFFLLYSYAQICNLPASMSPCPVPAPLCAHACQPTHTCLSLHPALHPPACLCPMPADLHLTMPGCPCCGCPCLPASAMSLVISLFTLFLCSHFQSACVHVPVPVPMSTSLCPCLSVLMPPTHTQSCLAAPVLAAPACLPLQ